MSEHKSELVLFATKPLARSLIFFFVFVTGLYEVFLYVPEWNSNKGSSYVLKDALSNLDTLKHEDSLNKDGVLHRNEQCEARNNVWYAKVHKTGSSTNSMIMYRYAWKHNLTVVPVIRPMTSSYQTHDIKKALEYFMFFGNDRNRMFHIMADHMIFKKELIQTLILPNVTFIASLRHPLAWLKSEFEEHHLKEWLYKKVKDPVKAFLQDPELFTKGTKIMGRNGLLGAFGVSPNLNNFTAIEGYIKYIEKTFHVVLINEYYMESILMLKRKLCWSTSDVIFTIKRSRSYSYKYNAYNEDLIAKHKAFTPGDYALYQHFVNHLLIELSLQPSDFWDELYEFKNIMHAVTEFCEDVAAKLRKNRKIIYDMAKERLHIIVQDIVISAVDCAIMKMDLKILRNVIRVRQNADLCLSPHVNNPSMDYINWTDKTERSISINEVLCSTWDPYYNFPLGVLASPDSYIPNLE